MSYCVNCGVELAKSEKRCPLCGTEVLNPALPPEDGQAARPYPNHIEHLDARIDRRYAATLASLLMLIPAFVTTVSDVFTSGRLTWSPYVVCSLLFVFTVCLLPMLLKRRSVYGCLLLDGLAAAVFLQCIDLLGEPRWFLTLGLPLTLVGTVYALLIAFLTERQRAMSVLMRGAVAVTGAGIAVVLVECAIRFHGGAFTWPRWSLFALFPCLVLSAGLLLLDRKARLKSEIRRRFFI